VEFTSEQWLRLKRRAQREKPKKHPEQLIAILEDIEALLVDLEKKIATEIGSSLRGPLRHQDRDRGIRANE
jgi:hypothetical protein